MAAARGCGPAVVHLVEAGADSGLVLSGGATVLHMSADMGLGEVGGRGQVWEDSLSLIRSCSDQTDQTDKTPVQPFNEQVSAASEGERVIGGASLPPPAPLWTRVTQTVCGVPTVPSPPAAGFEPCVLNVGARRKSLERVAGRSFDCF